MIPTIITSSQVGDVNTLAKSILNDFDNRDFSTDPYMTLQIEKLSSNNALMTEALNEKAAQSALAEVDEKRDNILRVIFHEINAKELWPDDSISQAASVVAEELDKYGFETISLAYSAESANINALLQDLKKTDVVIAIASLPDFGYLVNQLVDAQQEFETAFLQYVSMEIDKEKLLSATKLGFIIRTQINKEIVMYLKGIVLSKPEVYKKCAEVVAKVIDTNNSKVRNRVRG